MTTTTFQWVFDGHRCQHFDFERWIWRIWRHIFLVFTIELCPFRYLSIFKETAKGFFFFWGETQFDCGFPNLGIHLTWMLEKYGHSPCFSWWMWKVLRLWLYTHTVRIFLGSRWTWKLAELQGIHEFTFPSSVLHPSTHQQLRRRSENTQISGRIERFLQLSL